MRRRDEWLARAIGNALTPVERNMIMLAAELIEQLADEKLSDSPD